MIRSIPLLLSLALAGCGDFPKDSRGTLERAKGGAPVIVGYSLAEPWVKPGDDGPAGVEADLVRAWAEETGVRLRWVRGGESQLVESLHGGTIDLLIGGFTGTSAHVAKIGMTQPYLTTEIVVGAAPNTPAPESLDKVDIRYASTRPDFAAAIRGAGGNPIAAGPDALRPLAAVYAPELKRLGLVDSGKRLLKEKRVIATAPGENALTLSLDRFLHRQRPQIEARLAAEARSRAGTSG